MANAIMTAMKRTPPGVEPGVTGKEKQFQQNRQFGPGAMVPFPYSSEPPSGSRAGRYDGVYRGGAEARAIPRSRVERRVRAV